jgi:hypothetical protein
VVRAALTKDVDWLHKTVRIERGVVKQIVDDVKSSCSARTMACADELLDVLKRWRQTTQFSDAENWVFASAYKLGRQPLSYTFVWENLAMRRKMFNLPLQLLRLASELHPLQLGQLQLQMLDLTLSRLQPLRGRAIARVGFHQERA